MRAGLFAAGLWLLACAPNPYRSPTQVREYEILVPARDTLGQALAAAWQHAGFGVRRQPRGAGPPPAALVVFEFTEPGVAGPRWLVGRLHNARSGAVLAVVRLPSDSLPPDAASRAERLVAALLAAAGASPNSDFPTP